MLNLQCQWRHTLPLSLQLLTGPFSEIATTQLVGGTTHKLRPRSFWQVHITKLIAWSFYILCMSEPTLWTFIFKCELHLTVLSGYPSYSHILFLFYNGLKFRPCTHYNGIFSFSSRSLTRTAFFLVDSGSTNPSIGSELPCTHFLASLPSLILNAVVWVIFHTNILEAVTVPILVNAWIWTFMSLCKLALPFSLGYLACPIWNPFDLLGFRPNIFLFIFAGVFCSILVPQPIHHWSLSQMLTFSLLHHLLGFPYPSYF